MRIWRLQGRPEFEIGPSWYTAGCVEVDAPADEDGWEGYYWAYPIDNETGRVYDLPCLIRAEDVNSDDWVDIYAPGLMGCRKCCSLWAYMHYNCGYADGLPQRGEQFVVLYEGDILPEYHVADENADVFVPKRIVRVMDAIDFYEKCGSGELCEEDESDE